MTHPMLPRNMQFTIKTEIVKDSLGIPEVIFPKYTTQIINLAGSNAAATRPKVVGQMSDLTVQSGARTLREWREFYTRTGKGVSLQVQGDHSGSRGSLINSHNDWF